MTTPSSRATLLQARTAEIMRPTRRHWPELLCWLGVLLGFGLRLARLGAQSLWYDETVSAYLASQELPQLIRHTAGDIHPPGYYVLLHWWSRLAGDSEYALAFFSAVFGTLIVALSCRLAGKWLGRAGRPWAALVAATSAFQVWYSQEVRMYTLAAALGLVSLYTAWAWLACPERRHAWLLPTLGYLLSAVVGLYVLYYYAFLLVVLNLLAVGYLLRRQQLARLLAWLAVQLAVLLLYLPWLPIAWRQVLHPPVPPWRGALSLLTIAREAWTALAFGQSVQFEQVWPLLIAVGLIFGLGLTYAWRRSRLQRAGPGSAGWLVSHTFGPLALICLVSVVVPLYHVRYLFIYAPAFYILLAGGLTWLAQRARWLAAAGLLVWLSGSAFSIFELHTNPLYVADDLRAAVQFIADRWRPGDAVVINAGYVYTGFTYYYRQPIAGRLRLVDFAAAPPEPYPLLLQTGTIGGDPQLGWGDPESDFYATSEAETAAALERVTRAFPRLWMLRLYDTVTDAGGFVRSWLAQHTLPFEDQLFAGQSFMRVQGFLSAVQPAPPAGRSVSLEGGVSLLGYQVSPEASAGAPLDVVLWWQTAANSPTRDHPYAVSLKLWSHAVTSGQLGSPAAQRDEWPLGSLLLTPAWPPDQPVRHPMRLALPGDLQAGRYQLTVEIYDPLTLRPLRVAGSQEHLVRLEPIEIGGAR